MDLFTILDLGAALALLMASVFLVVIAIRYFNYSRFNLRRVLYLGSAGATFVFGLYLMGRSSPVIFDPVLRYIPVNPVERVIALVILLLIMHLWSHIREADHHQNRNVPIIPRSLTSSDRTNGGQAKEKGS